jgi:hypothetical protein
VEICQVLRQVHPNTKISLSALSVICDLMSYLLRMIFLQLASVSTEDAAKIYVREEVQVQDTIYAEARSEAVFAAKLANDEAHPAAAVIFGYAILCLHLLLVRDSILCNFQGGYQGRTGVPCTGGCSRSARRGADTSCRQRRK